MLDLTKYEGHDDQSTQRGLFAHSALHRDAPELLAEVVRLRADLAEAVAAVQRLMDGTSDLQDALDACNQARAVLAKHRGA